MFCTVYMLCLCKHGMSALLSLHQDVDGEGPPEGTIASLTMGLIGAEDLILISRTYKSLVRQTRILYGLGALWWACCC